MEAKIKEYLSEHNLMAIDNDNACAMFNLGMYYKGIGDMENTFKYWYQAIKHDCCDRVDAIIGYCISLESFDYGVLYINQIIDRPYGHTVVRFIKHFGSMMNADLVNIIVNMDACPSADEYGLLKQLVSI